MRPTRAKAQHPPPQPLPTGTRLGRYELRGVLGSGAFGITYRGLNTDSDEDVAIREYLPPSLARREGARLVVPNDAQDDETFRNGLRFFINEGQLLPRVQHEALVRVLDTWEDHGTAYMATPLLVGRELLQTFQARPRPPREEELRALLDSLLGAVEALHRAKLEHRDISPRTIMILAASGAPVLMEMGSARRVTIARGDRGPTGPRDGYAAPELYAQGTGHERGPWTDLYALGAVMYWLVGNKVPPPAPQRRAGDRIALELQRPDKRHSIEFLAIVDWMMAPEAKDRPQSVAELRAVLSGKALPERFRATRRSVAQRPAGATRRRWLLGGGGALALLGAAGGGAWWLRRSGRLRWPP